ncbi:hypothetical protein C9422_31615 [Pseudomonas sp. B1(2018)]|uniref:hypothetical protein n=1 Tax=Pseudomonas sp. B1(2018) TaxID=2233856 RepID=UPI000D5E5BF6|nr:hypothetical protein [Pseudomonas sp. B1(2018)]PVZ52159.1 hypothetical protein C9422_31615 [Pseudomonas sp. B1(2018)]
MADPLDKATSKAPATLGEGCLSRYDPDDMGPEDGTEFPGAAELWEQLQQESDELKGSQPASPVGAAAGCDLFRPA